MLGCSSLDFLRSGERNHPVYTSLSPGTVNTENNTSMLISKGRTFMSMFICRTNARRYPPWGCEYPHCASPGRAAAWGGWETWMSIKRTNPFLPPHQSHFFRRPKQCLSTPTVSALLPLFTVIFFLQVRQQEERSCYCCRCVSRLCFL